MYALLRYKVKFKISEAQTPTSHAPVNILNRLAINEVQLDRGRTQDITYLPETRDKNLWLVLYSLSTYCV